MLLITKNIKNFSFTYPCPRKLRQIMKMSMIQRQSTYQIQQIWKQYHAPRPNNICTAFSKDKYHHVLNRAGLAPFFLIPVMKKGGHYKLLTQWQKDCFLATYLQDYKRKGTQAPPYVVFTLFTQLLFTKGIVLMRGDIINNSMTKPQAQKVWQHIQNSYTVQSQFNLVHKFNNSPADFDQRAYNQFFGLSS